MNSSRESPPAVTALNEWLKGPGRSQTMLAALIPAPRPTEKRKHITPQTVSQWARNVARPDDEQAEILEVITGGAVKKADWKLPGERRAHERALRRAAVASASLTSMSSAKAA